MIADYNLKALVFDDVEEEAKPLIDALNYERVPNIYINFKDDDRDDRKIKNIRIIFTDLIVGAYMGGDDQNAVEAIRVSILDNISPDNGPFILVAWSKHSELVDLLKKRILEIEPGLNFVTVELSKHDFFEEVGDGKWKLKTGIDFEDIRLAIKEQLKGLEHFEIFLEWENDARSSISKILNNFLENIDDKKEVTDTVSGAIKSTLGKQKEPTSKDKLNAFYHTLNTTLADSINSNVAPENKHDDFLNALELENIDTDMKAAINRKTLFENCDDDNTLKTGNIYSFNDFENKFSEDVIKEICGYDVKKIIGKEFFHHTEITEDDGKGNIIKRLCNTFCREKGETALVGKNKFSKECSQYTKDNMYPILMEFTPSCDIAQKKYTKSRLIFGYLFDSKLKCIKNKSESLYMTSFHFKYKDEERDLDSNYRLVLFIKNIFAVNPEKIKEMTPMIRGRKEFVTDLQHAIANHISRIGISSIDDKF